MSLLAAFIAPLALSSRGSRTRWAPESRHQRARCGRASLMSSNGGGSSNGVMPPTPPEEEGSVAEIDIKPLRWSEIPFVSLEEELRAIDEYVEEEDLPEDDAWPKFLRAAAYEHWGQPKLALAQYGLVNGASGLRRVPELWERRAYNAFKVGDVAAANAYFDVALRLYKEAVGNELHFTHWFYTNFKDYVPKANGPARPVQRGICKYCVGLLSPARESLVSQIAIQAADCEHAMLWLMASSIRLSNDSRPAVTDMDMVRQAIETYDRNDPVLAPVIALFLVAAEGSDEKTVADALKKLESSALSDDEAGLVQSFYLALYYDAYVKDDKARDGLLDRVSASYKAISSPSSTEDYLYFAAKNRLSAPPGFENAKVWEYQS